MPTAPTVASFEPSSGISGTKVYLKISSQDDLLGLSSTQPLVLFGTTKCHVELIRDAQAGSVFGYSCSVDAPPSLVTGGNNSVALSFIIEAPAGVEISRTLAGTFHYLEGSEDDITRADKLPKDDTTTPAADMDQASPSPKTEAPSSAATNTYEYPPQQYGNTFSQASTDMITTYRTSSFTDPHYHHHHRRAPPGWGVGGYGSNLAAVGRSSSTFDSITIPGRSTTHHLPIPSSGNSGTPQLVRTSTINNGSGNGSYHPMSLYTSKAVLKIHGKLSDMAMDWTQEEWDNRRRIVMFKKAQNGAVLSVSFKPVAVNERPTNSICISCIWWAEKSECYVTSVDTIHLLEQLVAAPNRFSVEEKNRIRRNLEGFHPSTVSKAKPDSEEFFKIIMAFPHPKPRNIEKDVKVFPWTALEPALKKIIGKYSATPSSILPPATMTPVNASSYATLPTPPSHHGLGSQHSLSQHADPHGQYPMHSAYGSAHHEAIPSPRSQASWPPASAYSTSTTRGLSPALRGHHSPQQPSSMRINTSAAQLPAVSAYDARGVAASPYGSTGLHTPISHHAAAPTPPRWDTTPAAYTDSGYPGLTSQQPPGAQSVYGTSAYGDGPQRS